MTVIHVADLCKARGKGVRNTLLRSRSTCIISFALHSGLDKLNLHSIPKRSNMSSYARNLNSGLNLSSKLAVVAGGSQGIGRGIAIRLARVSIVTFSKSTAE